MPLLPAGFTPSRGQPEIDDDWPASENHGVTPPPTEPEQGVLCSEPLQRTTPAP